MRLEEIVEAIEEFVEWYEMNKRVKHSRDSVLEAQR